MAEDRKAGAALALSIPAAIAAVAAYINSRKAGAAPPGGELVLPEEVVELLVALAASVDQIDDTTRAALRALAELSISVQGWPANTDSLTSIRVLVAVTGTRLPDIFIPSGMSLVIKAWALNPGLLQIGASQADCTNINQSFPLLPSEIVAYQVQNANQIYIAGTVAGCTACLTVEQRKRGGG